MRPNMQYIFFEVQQKAVDSLKIGIAISLSKKIKFNFSEIQQNEISKKLKQSRSATRKIRWKPYKKNVKGNCCATR